MPFRFIPVRISAFSKKCAPIVLLVTGLLLSGGVGRADAAADRAALVETARQMAEINQQVEAMRKDKPADAIALVQKFQAEHATFKPAYLASLDALIAKIYYENLKDSDKALAAIEVGLPRTQEASGYLPLVRYKLYLLMLAGKHDEVKALFRKELPRYLSEPTADFSWLQGALMYYVQSARGAGKMDDYISDVRAILAEQPELITYRYIGPELVNYLLTQPGKDAEALSWAKLYWMLCDFDEKTLGEATAVLQKAWIARDTNTVKSSAFLTAMQDAKADNPLKDIPLPELDKAKLRAALDKLPEASIHSRISLMLMLGENAQAMLTARRVLLDDPTGKATQAALEIARVFKASGLNLVRANAFLKYFQSSQGENPLDAFFKEHAAG
jgi:hypothetical protein